METGGVKGERREAKVPETPVLGSNPGGAWRGSSCETGCNAEVGTAEICRHEDPFQLAQDPPPHLHLQLHVFICVGHSQTKIGSEVF